MQRGSTPLESRAAHAGAVQTEIVINQPPGAGYFLSHHWTEESRQVITSSGDVPEAGLATGGVLPWYQAEPGYELPVLAMNAVRPRHWPLATGLYIAYLLYSSRELEGHFL